MGIVSSALGALGQTSTSSGMNQSHSVGGTWGSGAAAMDFNHQMMLAQQAYNSAEAQKNRDWQEHMSNTAYQRAVQDMKKAGINPILAYQQGGASTPGGSAASAGMASGVTDTYNQSDSMGMNSAYSYSNFGEGLKALGNSIGNIFDGLTDLLPWAGSSSGTDLVRTVGAHAIDTTKAYVKKMQRYSDRTASDGGAGRKDVWEAMGKEWWK